MSYQLNIGLTSVKHWFKVLVKHQLILFCFYMRVSSVKIEISFTNFLTSLRGFDEIDGNAGKNEWLTKLPNYKSIMDSNSPESYA